MSAGGSALIALCGEAGPWNAANVDVWVWCTETAAHEGDHRARDGQGDTFRWLNLPVTDEPAKASSPVGDDRG